MNLSRLRELVQAGKDGSIRPEELQELFEALPWIVERIEYTETLRCTISVMVQMSATAARQLENYASSMTR